MESVFDSDFKNIEYHIRAGQTPAFSLNHNTTHNAQSIKVVD